MKKDPVRFPPPRFNTFPIPHPRHFALHPFLFPMPHHFFSRDILVKNFEDNFHDAMPQSAKQNEDFQLFVFMIPQ